MTGQRLHMCAADVFQSILPGKSDSLWAWFVTPARAGWWSILEILAAQAPYLNLIRKVLRTPRGPAAWHCFEVQLENEQAWVWFKELDDDQLGRARGGRGQAAVRRSFNLILSKFHKIFAELDTWLDLDGEFVEFVHWFSGLQTAGEIEDASSICFTCSSLDRWFRHFHALF